MLLLLLLLLIFHSHTQMTTISNWEWTGLLAAAGSGTIYYFGFNSFVGNELMFVAAGAGSGVGGYYLYRWLNDDKVYATWVKQLALAGGIGAAAGGLFADVVLKRPMAAFLTAPLAATAASAYILRE